ncbi:MAG: glycosyltransferase involved in cell wall biosynthesis [Urechidicola sp.]|jgi:glycosyltransferase involved in cell wall biosynthesis
MISILITHYNRPNALKACIQNIRSINWPIPFEIVVSDDGSTDENLSKINSESIDKLVLADTNQGLASNLNKGIKACEGDYLLYCQEDAIISLDIEKILLECLSILDDSNLDMIRLRANYKFPHLINVSENILRIPRFSFRNFNVNTFQYSDNPFITRTNFFNKYGYYLEGTSGPYGETEYAIRILNSNVNIGITKIKYAFWQKEIQSIINTQIPIKNRKGPKELWRFLRALRQHLEWVLYFKKNRKLKTYKNNRK